MCTRRVTRNKNFGFDEMKRDNTKKRMPTNEINGFATMAERKQKVQKMAKTGDFELKGRCSTTELPTQRTGAEKLNDAPGGCKR